MCRPFYIHLTTDLSGCTCKTYNTYKLLSVLNLINRQNIMNDIVAMYQGPDLQKIFGEILSLS